MENKIKETPREEVSGSSIPNKLLEFQKRVSAISKDSVNPFFKSKYFDVNTVIDTIKPILNEVGLVVLQPMGIQDGKNILITEIWDGSDLVNNSLVLIPEIADIQKFGAALTYLRRYALVSLLLLQGEEDDDGNAAVKQKSAISKTETPKPSSGASKGMGMTDKQNKMIHALMKEKGVMTLGEIGIKPIEKPTTADASMIIDELMKYQPRERIIQLDEPINFENVVKKTFGIDKLEPTREDIP